MKSIVGSSLVLCGSVCTALSVAAQPPVGALAIDERQGDQYGWAVDYETAGAAQSSALRECGSRCSVVLTFGRCAAYAADQDGDSTAEGWAESFASADGARRTALMECGSRGGSGCMVRVWGCNSHVVEEGLGLDRAARRQVQEGLQAAGFDPGGADGMFGPRTRSAIRSWQTSRGARATGYLDGASVAALGPSIPGQPTFRQREPVAAVSSARAPAASAPSSAAQQQASPPASSEAELVFWQSIANSTNPAEFEAYLSQFPNGVFRALADVRLAALRAGSNGAPPPAGRPAGGVGSPPSGARVSAAGGASFGGAAVADAPRAGDVFRDCEGCPEMVVLAGGGLAMGRYEVTVGEYRAFVSATGGGAGAGCVAWSDGDSWQNPGFPQTDRHPVTCVSWEDAQEYVSWLSRRTGATYRLPTEAEWGRAASGSQPGCDRLGRGSYEGTCPVGQYGTNAAGLSDMVGNVMEWTSACREGDCGRRVVRGGSWFHFAEDLRPGARRWFTAGRRGRHPRLSRFEDAGLSHDSSVLYLLGGWGAAPPSRPSAMASSSAGGQSARRTGPALESMYRFVLWLLPTVEKFPRRQKFLLGRTHPWPPDPMADGDARRPPSPLVGASSSGREKPNAVGVKPEDGKWPLSLFRRLA